MCNLSKGHHNKPAYCLTSASPYIYLYRRGSSYPISMPGNVLYSHRGNDKNKPKCSPCRSAPLRRPHARIHTPLSLPHTLHSAIMLLFHDLISAWRLFTRVFSSTRYNLDWIAVMRNRCNSWFCCIEIWGACFYGKQDQCKYQHATTPRLL